MPGEVAHCKHCGGDLIREDGVRKCLSCGREWKTLRQREQFYLTHQAEILADIARIGRPAAIEKWQIPSPTLAGLLRRWLHENKEPSPTPAAHHSDNHLPDFPVFNENWSPEVKREWLETYRVVATKERKEGITSEQSNQG